MEIGDFNFLEKDGGMEGGGGMKVEREVYSDERPIDLFSSVREATSGVIRPPPMSSPRAQGVGGGQHTHTHKTPKSWQSTGDIGFKLISSLNIH